MKWVVKKINKNKFRKVLEMETFDWVCACVSVVLIGLILQKLFVMGVL